MGSLPPPWRRVYAGGETTTKGAQRANGGYDDFPDERNRLQRWWQTIRQHGGAANLWDQLGVPTSELLGDERDAAAPLAGPIRWEALAGDELSWLTIAVLDPVGPAGPMLLGGAERWWRSVGDQLVNAALQESAQDFEVTFRPWGVVFEVGFITEAQATAFRTGATLRSAVDQLGPIRLEVTTGRGGGTAGVRSPRRPRPFAGAGAAELPEPEPVPEPLVAPAIRHLAAALA